MPDLEELESGLPVPEDGDVVELEDEVETVHLHSLELRAAADGPAGPEAEDGVMTTMSAAEGTHLGGFLGGKDAMLGEPVLMSPITNQEIDLADVAKPVRNKRDATDGKADIHFEIKLAPDIHGRAKRQSSDSMPNPSVTTIGLESTQQTSATFNSSTAPYPLGNSTTGGPTATGSLISLPTMTTDGSSMTSEGSQPSVSQTIAPNINLAHPIRQPGKFLKCLLVSTCLVGAFWLS